MKACKIISLSIFAIVACISCNNRGQVEENAPKMEVIVQEMSPNTLKGVIRLTDKDNISRIGLLYWQAADSLQTTEMLVLDDVQTGDNPFELQNLQYHTTYVLMGFADAEQGADYKYAINSSPTKAMTDIELPDAEYQLVFSDEFEEDGAPSSQWTCETTSISSRGPLWTDNEENVYVKDGCLHLVMTDAGMNSLNYSASLNTSKSFNMCYGKLECKIKIPFSSDVYSQIILLGNKHIWPENGEIDVAEFGGCHISSYIGWGSETKWQANWESNIIPLLECTSSDKSKYDVFHVIRMEWDKDSIRTWCDDRPILEADISEIRNKGIYEKDVNTDNPFVYHEDGFGHYITLRLDSKSYIKDMEEIQVDYIRVWQRKRLPEE